MFGNIVQYRFQTVHILFFLTGVILENLDGKIVIQLEQKFKDQAVEAEQISIRADIINDLKLFQNGFKHSLFGLLSLIFYTKIKEKNKLSKIRNIFFHKIQRNLKEDCCIWRSAFRRMQNISIDYNAVLFLDSEAFRFYCYIQRTLLHINDFNCPMPVHGDVASRISGSTEFDIGINRCIYNFM